MRLSNSSNIYMQNCLEGSKKKLRVFFLTLVTCLPKLLHSSDVSRTPQNTRSKENSRGKEPLPDPCNLYYTRH